MRTLPLRLAGALLLGTGALLLGALSGAAANQPGPRQAALASENASPAVAGPAYAHPYPETFPQGYATNYQSIYEPSPSTTAAYQVVATLSDTGAYDSASLAAGDPLALDDNRDGGLTHSEVQHYNRGNFERHDLDGNGWLSPDEWDLRAQEHFGHRVNPAPLQTRTQDTFAEHDLDGDTRISRSEWDARIRAEFTLLDADRDGRVVPPEIARPSTP